MWLSRTVGTINFTASPRIYSRKMERFCRETEHSPGWEGCWMFCTLPCWIWEKCQRVLGRKKYRCKPLLYKKKKRHLWSLECSRQLQYPQCNSGQCAEFSVDIGSKLHSPSISSASTMTLISAQQLTRIDLVVGNGSLWWFTCQNPGARLAL